VAKELGPVLYATGSTVRGVLFRGATVRDVVADAWDAWADADIDDYDIAFAEEGAASGVYYADLPAGVTLAEEYELVCFAGAATLTDFRAAFAKRRVGPADANVVFVAGAAASVAGAVDANVVAISGDATAADNLESYTDGTAWLPVDLRGIEGSAAGVPGLALLGLAYDSVGQLNADVVAINGQAAIAAGQVTFPAAVGTSTLTAAQVNAEVDTALADYDPPTHAELTAAAGAVTLADGVLHGGTTARLRLGATGSTTAVTISAEDGRGVLVSTTAGTGNAVELAATDGAALRATGQAGSGVVQVAGSGATAKGLVVSGAAGALQLTATTGNGLAVTSNGVAVDIAGTLGDITGDIDGSLSGTVGGVAGTTTTLDALQTALSTAHGAGSWATAAGFSTHSAADVVTALGTGATLTALATAAAVGDIPTAAETAAAVLAAGDVDGFTLEQTLKLCLAALAGKLSGAATTTVTIRAADDSKARVTAVVDADGNRSTVTLDAAG
jgi:hypothetical protein